MIELIAIVCPKCDALHLITTRSELSKLCPQCGGPLSFDKDSVVYKAHAAAAKAGTGLAQSLAYRQAQMEG